MKRIKSIFKFIIYPFLPILYLIRDSHPWGPQLNIIKTIYVNFRAFDITTAIKFPILIYGPLRIYSLGNIILKVPRIKPGLVRIGIVDVKTTGVTKINNRGSIIFNGRCDIWGGCYFELSNTASLNIGAHTLIGENVRFLLQGQCTIGNYVRLAYDSQIMDTDFHYLVNIESGEIKDCKSNVSIGDYNWIGNHTTIKKGTITPNYTIVAAPNSMLNKDYRKITSECPVLGGSPAKEISRGVRRVFSVTNQYIIDNHFKKSHLPYVIDIAKYISLMQSNTRIAVNTVVIYIRLLITIFVSLFSTRYVLLALGETNFGIYNLIAGVVALFSFISATMAGTTQRYISYNMGQGDMQLVRKVFYNSRIIHLIITIIVAVLIETAGLYLVNNILTIPIEKLPDARFVLHCVTIGLVFTILTVPYEAVLMAHENILFVSLVTIFNSFVKLGGAIILLYIAINKLRLYAVIMAILPIICLILQYIYCKKNYNETRPSSPRHLSVMDFSLIKEMSGYAGWVMIGVTCGTVRTQGTAILLNLFFGVIANAANGIATQVNGLMQQFSTSITTSIRPQLVKSAGEGNQHRMITLTYAACKYPSLLLGLFAIPLVVAMQYVLEIWLKEVPDNTVVFCRLMILSTIFNQLTMGLTTAIEATGKVKLLHMIIGSMHIISIPVAYVLFKIGYPPQTIFWCIVVEEFIAAIFRLVLAKKMINIGIRRYIKDVLIRVLFVMVLTGVVCFTIWSKLNINIYNLILMCIISVIIYALLVFIYGFNVQERNTLLDTIQIGIKKIKLLM